MPAKNYMKNPHLEGDDINWQGNNTGILLIHGFTATTAEVRFMAEKLHSAGFSISAPLLPGHGTHPDDLNRATWHQWLQKVKQSYETLLRQCDQIYVIGESMGAVLAIELAVLHPEIAGLMLFAPAIKVKNLWFSKLLSLFKPHLEKSGEDDSLPWKGYTLYPLKAAVEMYQMQKHARTQLGKIKQPLQIFTGALDHTISPDSAKIILEDTESIHKCHLHMPKSSHVILIDQELDQAFEHVLAFINGPKLQKP